MQKMQVRIQHQRRKQKQPEDQQVQYESYVPSFLSKNQRENQQKDICANFKKTSDIKQSSKSLERSIYQNVHKDSVILQDYKQNNQFENNHLNSNHNIPFQSRKVNKLIHNKSKFKSRKFQKIKSRKNQKDNPQYRQALKMKNWMIFLMHESKHYDEEIIKNRLELSMAQFKRQLKLKRKTTIFITSFPKILRSIKSGKKHSLYDDQDEKQLLKMIFKNNLKNNQSYQQRSAQKQDNVQTKKKNETKKILNSRIDQQQSQSNQESEYIQKQIKRNNFQRTNDQKILRGRQNQQAHDNVYQIKLSQKEQIYQKKTLNSKQIAQKNTLYYLLIKKYGIQNQMIQLILDQTTDEIKSYYKENKQQIQNVGTECVRFYYSHSQIIECEQEQRDKKYIMSLLRTQLQGNQHFQKPKHDMNEEEMQSGQVKIQ